MTLPLDRSKNLARFACLSTYGGHSGGATIAMERLAAGLRALGAHVDVITRADCPPPSSTEKRLERAIRRGIKYGRTSLSNTLFTADWPAQDVTGHAAVVAADIVNVHWAAGFVNAAGVRHLVQTGKRVAWTLHDMRAFTGGCHYATGCRGFTGTCQACPQLVGSLHELPARSLARARRRLAGLPLVFIAPSRWMADELTSSAIFDSRSHVVRVIPTGLDLDLYRPADSADIRRRLGLPPDALCILLGSVSLSEHRKGIDVALAAVARATASLVGNGSTPPIVLTYGAGEVSTPGVRVKSLGSLDEAGVIEAVHASDIHLTTAREDNLPNTVMEALACGRPVVGTATGGIPDMVTDGVNGWLVPVDDADATANVIERLALDRSLVAVAGRHARTSAEENWDARLQARRYLALAAVWPVEPLASARTTSQVSGARTASFTPAAAVIHRGGPLRGPLRRLRRVAMRALRPRGVARSSASEPLR
jgi:glycosyltransferase involved in cell wall biosynthesis